MGRIDGIMRAVCATPWAILPEKLEAILDVLEMRAEGLRFTAEEIRARVGDGMRGAPAASTQGAIAVLPLYGVIAPRMGMMTDVSGGTSAEQFGREFDGAIGNPQVSAVVIDADTPGGNTAGIPELAAKIRAGRAVKPVYAVANHQMASAGYYLCAQATQIIASPSALLGAVGVYTVHTDRSGADAQEGIKRTVISAGERKAAGMIGALDDETRSEIEAIVGDTYAMMVRDIAAGRGITVKAVEANYGQGKVFSAQAALTAGLIDRIATLEDVLGELAAGPPQKQRLRADTNITLAATDSGGVLTLGMPNGDFSYYLVADKGTSTMIETALRLVPAASAASPTLPAPQAKEKTVSDTPTVAPGAAQELAVVQAALARSERIDEMCALVSASAADAAAFKASDKTPEQIRVELLGRQKKPTPTPGVSVGADREADRPFASLGEQLVAIAAYGANGSVDKRLLAIQAAVSGGSANVPSDGAFLIQQDFSTDLMKESMGEGQLASRCSTTEVSANADGLEVVYIDETSRANGSRWGGVQAYWAAEADSATAKKPKIGEWNLRLAEIIGSAYMTERLLKDAPAMQSVYEEGFRAEFAFMIDDGVIRGTGSGQMLGLLNHIYNSTTGLGSVISVAKESGQAADTFLAENVIAMWARLHPRSKTKAVWFINQEIEQQLQVMQIGTGTSGQLVYMPAGGLSGASFGTIYGRPVVIVEQCSAPGDVGDVILGDLSQYKIITKGGVEGDNSIHVRFLNHERTFRWIARVNGAPKDKTVLTPYKGTLKLSSFVTLAAR
jgi:HK97 family phage major capsid protein